MKYVLFFLFCWLVFFGFSQELPSTQRMRTVFAVKDTIHIDSVSIQKTAFEIRKKDGNLLDNSFYKVNFLEAKVIFTKPFTEDSVVVKYLKYPAFLTKKYGLLRKDIIVKNQQQPLYKLNEKTESPNFFEGLNTSGSIARGIAIGNNQNSVLNSELDLQISGKLSDKVSIRASIQDANIPLQESGYSQRLDEFDQVFVELFSTNWNIRAGDIDLLNTTSYFSKFSKRVQGLSANVNVMHSQSNTYLFTSGALVRGQFASSQFNGQEGNQGPYKLQGPNGELYVLVVSGSETVYVNGIALQRGENHDYIINYNAGEILFNSTYPITSEMRITVDYQYSEQSYSRLVAYGGANYKSEKLQLQFSVFNENDAKNNPLQQNLSPNQVTILQEAGDATDAMVAPSAVEEPYSENKILYEKQNVNGQEVFVFSTNSEATLYAVRFTNVGANEGNYIINTNNAIATIYEYIAPVNGVPQGSYEPIIQLIAPEKLQVASLNGTFTPTTTTALKFELAGSKHDTNLFSSKDDANNNGFASHFTIEQQINNPEKNWNLKALGFFNYVQENFRSIERLYNSEFIRNWNLEQDNLNQNVTQYGNQLYFKTGLSYQNAKSDHLKYWFENLNYRSHFKGNKHLVMGNFNFGNFSISSHSSFMHATSTENTSSFNTTFTTLQYTFANAWLGSKIAAERNVQKNKTTQEVTALSQKFTSYEFFLGVGDSTKIFGKLGYKHRVNDSVVATNLQRVNVSNTFYLKSQLLQNKSTNLSLFTNYRVLKNKIATKEKEVSLNSRLQYQQNIAKQFIVLNSLYETNSGTLPQQEFTYVEVEPGQGAYTWIDYNENSIQELEEFEIAPFADQGTYIRVLLPNQIFVKTHQNKWSSSITLNPHTWNTSNQSFLKIVSKFYNQSSYLIDRKEKRTGTGFNLNPFKDAKENGLGVNESFRNVLFFNRGKQKYTTSYTFLSTKNKSLFSIGLVANATTSHQLLFTHLIAKNWLFTFSQNFSNSASSSEAYTSKNYRFKEVLTNPKISYLANETIRLDFYYQFASTKNKIENLEALKQHKYGISFAINTAKYLSVNGEFNYFSNGFSGATNTPVAYQMLEGLQKGTNFTWSFFAQQKLTKFLDLNLSYFGRKSETSSTIHTGNIQLKAYF